MKRVKFMGILNVTPDSFSGDGMPDPREAAARFAEMVEAGADIIDIGAESTRPNATPLTTDEEWARLKPVLEIIRDHPLRARVRISLDSYHPATLSRAIPYGVDIVNDVTGLTDTAMRELLAMESCDVVVMHALTVPVDPAVTIPEGTDVLTLMRKWRREMIAQAVEAGIDPDRLIFDPGLGFGKTPEQSMHLALHAGELVENGGRWLIGHSRKSFLKLITDAEGAGRDEATVLLSALMMQAGVDILRVHNVAAHQAMRERLCT